MMEVVVDIADMDNIVDIADFDIVVYCFLLQTKMEH